MKRYTTTWLNDTLVNLFMEAGASQEVSEVTSNILIEGDLLGHHTHGVKLANGYFQDLKSGHAKGDHKLLTSKIISPVAELFDGNFILGPYLVQKALENSASSARKHGIGIVTIKRSHHIACLAAYLQSYVDQNLVPIIMTSDPAVKSVAPFGGITPVYTPNPIAMGIPSREQPIIMDVSMSTVTNGSVAKANLQNEMLSHPVILTNTGKTSVNPADFFSDPQGSILPLGGVEFGHKGFAMGLMVEALTSALGGFGRKDEPTGWGASVTVLVIDPSLFSGTESFLNETDTLVKACLESRSINPQSPVRMPGQSGLKCRRNYLEEGVLLPRDVVDELKKAIDNSSLKGCMDG
ncbi:Ldh family oxidoreductase [Marinomonas ushuaiensis DSM 15871]|uniref:Ldh family oxidoreductase n=1 Tax=Marinomonas ushuaiensis DSM 15871 TaxID=1122207 RepID=X7E4W9_9GAMM|nr:Ldh family oxidoreductase [Marinomonas ushuaiensis]ETX10223.1 Ldh family oxidoreductase [Marinomonas ushuaiensis DSM 15871]